jgi:hypothetical protein
MTEAEAGEILLEGKPYRDCMHGCSGGWVNITTGVRACPICDGYSNVLKREYREACDFLRLPYPERQGTDAYRLQRSDVVERGHGAIIAFIEDKEFLKRLDVAIAEKERA